MLPHKLIHIIHVLQLFYLEIQKTMTFLSKSWERVSFDWFVYSFKYFGSGWLSRSCFVFLFICGPLGCSLLLNLLYFYVNPCLVLFLLCTNWYLIFVSHRLLIRQNFFVFIFIMTRHVILSKTIHKLTLLILSLAKPFGLLLVAGASLDQLI